MVNIRFPTPFPAQWLLSGTNASPGLDSAAWFAVMAGLELHFVRPGAYRVHGPQGAADALQSFISACCPDVSLGQEPAPNPVALNFRLDPARRSLRTAEIHGSQEAGADRLLARALDAGLSVQCVGPDRFAVTGTSHRLVNWLAVAKGYDRAAALAELGITEETVAAEDAAPPPIAVEVALPVRQVASTITRDSSGNIVSVVQTERDMPPSAGEVAE